MTGQTWPPPASGPPHDVSPRSGPRPGVVAVVAVSVAVLALAGFLVYRLRTRSAPPPPLTSPSPVVSHTAPSPSPSPEERAGGVPRGTETFAETDRSHTQSTVRYDRVPPAGGPHDGRWQSCGIYEAPVRDENAVHSLEHGAVWITYDPSLPARDVEGLRRLVTSHGTRNDRHILLSPYPGLPAPVVVTAWGNQLRLERAADPRLAQFVDHFLDPALAPEPGASCSGGVGTPVG